MVASASELVYGHVAAGLWACRLVFKKLVGNNFGITSRF